MDQELHTVDRLLEQAKDNPEKLGRLLERYRAFLLTYAHRSLGRALSTRIDPTDIVQETLMQAAKAFGGFTGSAEAEFSVWLGRIHERTLADVFRTHLLSKKRDARQEQRLYDADGSVSFCWREPAADQTTPSVRVIRGEKALRLAEVLQQLPEAQRDAVRLRYLEGHAITDVAQELDKTLPATAGLIKRGLAALRSKMRADDSWV